MKLLLVFIMLIHSTILKADDHDWSQFGNSALLQTDTYGFSKKALKMKTGEAMFFSAVVTFSLTSMYSVLSTGPGQPYPAKDMGYNLLGQAAALGLCYSFEF